MNRKSFFKSLLGISGIGVIFGALCISKVFGQKEQVPSLSNNGEFVMSKDAIDAIHRINIVLNDFKKIQLETNNILREIINKK